MFNETFRGPRWEALEARGARVQRPLWASTSTKNPDYPDTLYVDTDDVVRVLEEQGVASFAKSFDELLTALDDKRDSLG